MSLASVQLPNLVVPKSDADHRSNNESIKSFAQSIREAIGTGSSAEEVIQNPFEPSALQAEIAELQKEIAELQAEIDALKPKPVVPVTYTLVTDADALIAVRESAPGSISILDNTLDNGDSILGLTMTAGLATTKVQVYGNGSLVVNTAWTWTAHKPIFAATLGGYTQTVPTSGYRAILGYAITPQVIILLIDEDPIFQNSNGSLPQAMHLSETGLLETLAAYGIRQARVMSDVNVAALTGLGPIGGVTLADGDRVFLEGQTTGAQNGLWIAHGTPTPAWTRPPEFGHGTQAAGLFIVVGPEGSIDPSTLWFCNNVPGTDVVDTDVLTFQQITASTPPLVPGIWNLAQAATKTNVATLSGPQTIDGLALSAGEVALLLGQSTATQKGPWTIATGAWTRPTWFANGANAAGLSIIVEDGGTLFGNTQWVNTNLPGSDVIGTAALTFNQYGTITGVNVGPFSPLFTTSNSVSGGVATAAFTAVNQLHGLFYASDPTTDSLPPFFRSIAFSDLPSGLGTVTSFSAGNLTPLFNTSVATPTTTPALSFSLLSHSPNTFLAADATGASTNPPTFRTIQGNDLQSPPGIGFTTPNTGDFTELTANQIGAASFTTKSVFGAVQWRLQQNSGDESNSGTIDYGTFDIDAVSIVGKGTTAGDRRIKLYDKVGIQTPASGAIGAYLSLPAQGGTLGQISLAPGSLLSSPVTNTTEWDGSDLFITDNGGTRNQIAYIGESGQVLALVGPSGTLSGTLPANTLVNNGDTLSGYVGFTVKGSGSPATPSLSFSIGGATIGSENSIVQTASDRKYCFIFYATKTNSTGCFSVIFQAGWSTLTTVDAAALQTVTSWGSASAVSAVSSNSSQLVVDYVSISKL